MRNEVRERLEFLAELRVGLLRFLELAERAPFVSGSVIDHANKNHQIGLVPRIMGCLSGELFRPGIVSRLQLRIGSRVQSLQCEKTGCRRSGERAGVSEIDAPICESLLKTRKKQKLVLSVELRSGFRT